MDHRAVPVEVLRDFARNQTELSSIRHVAAEAGLGRTTLHKFIAGGTMPHPRVRRLLALWYLRKVGGAEDEEVSRPYAAALDILLAGVPDETRVQAAKDLLDVLERGYLAAGGEKPRWLGALRTRSQQIG